MFGWFKREKVQEGGGSVVRKGTSRVTVDAATVMRIKSMELRARVVVEGYLNGLHRSPYHGFSVEFTEYRNYTPGDETRHIDWRVYARSDRHYIRKYEDETNLRCYLLVDHSQSMAYTSGEYSKAAYGGTLAASLAYFLFGQGDAVGLITFDEKIDQMLPVRNRPGHLRSLMLALDKEPLGKGTDVHASLDSISSLLRKRGMVILVSDLLTPVDELDLHLGRLRAYGHEVYIFNVLDPAELRFTFEEAARFKDVESGQTVILDPAVAKTEYIQRLTAHFEKVRSICKTHGVGYHQIATDQPFELAINSFLSGRSRNFKRVRMNNR